MSFKKIIVVELVTFCSVYLLKKWPPSFRLFLYFIEPRFWKGIKSNNPTMDFPSLNNPNCGDLLLHSNYTFTVPSGKPKSSNFCRMYLWEICEITWVLLKTMIWLHKLFHPEPLPRHCFCWKSCCVWQYSLRSMFLCTISCFIIFAMLHHSYIRQSCLYWLKQGFFLAGQQKKLGRGIRS